MAQYLDKAGLTYFWGKIKAWVSNYAKITTSNGVNTLTVGNTSTTLQEKITSSNKISADLIADGVTNKAYTATEQTKLSGIAAGAQVNVIETVKVNNTALTPTNKAVNIDLSSYDKAPLIIEVNDTNTTVPSGTYASITAALAEEREVVVKVTMTEDDEEIFYLNFVVDYSQADTNYYFNTVQYLSSYDFSIDVADQCSFNKHNIADAEHYHGNITNGGDITATAPTIANGDQLVINDHSASKITNGPTFDGSTTTTALTPKGTWEPFLKTAPVQSVNGQTGAVSLTLGDTNVIETVKVNNTALTPDANKAVNIDLSSYDKAPLIIEIDSTDTTVPSGTYTNIGNALANGREVYIKMNGDDYSVIYLKLCGVFEGHSKCYEFLGSTVMANIWNDNTLDIYAAGVHNHGGIDNDGTLNHSQAISIANGDRIVITDASSNEKIQKTSITFDGSTTSLALSKKGTWETFLNNNSKGVANGVCPLDANTKIDAQYLPSYVDDVVEIVTIASSAPATCSTGDVYYNSTSKKLFTATAANTWASTGVDPQKGVIYVLTAATSTYDANSEFRWGGSDLVQLYDGGVSAITNGEIDIICANL